MGYVCACASWRLQRASFLRFAIENGWGTRAGGLHSLHDMDGVAEKWKIGDGRCPEVIIDKHPTKNGVLRSEG